MSSKRVNVMELFSKAREESVVSTGVCLAVLNERFPLPVEGGKRIEVSDSASEELPSFLSDPITVSELPTTPEGVIGRLVAASSQYLCMGRGAAVVVVDMTCGSTNEKSIETALRSITDLSFNGNLLLFTDGIDIGLVKPSGSVALAGSVYVKNVGSVDDPVRVVQQHPAGPHFVTVRAKAGWVLWDIARLIMKSKHIDSDERESVGVPELFRSVVVDAGLYESCIPWKPASNLLAGKKLSPGVLAILKRDTSPEFQRSASGELGFFAFSADGRMALASAGGSVRAWAIGPKCVTVEAVSQKVLEPVTSALDDIDPVACAALGSSRFAVAGNTSIFLLSLDPQSVAVLRTISFSSSVRLTSIAAFAEDGLVASTASSTLLFLSKTHLTPVGLGPSLDSVSSLVLTQATPNQQNMYLCGSVEGGLVWVAQTVDTKMFVAAAEEIERPLIDEAELPIEDPYEEFMPSEPRRFSNHSSVGPETVTAPDRLESNFGNSHQTDLSAVREGQATIAAEIEVLIQQQLNREIAKVLKEKLARLEQAARSAVEAERGNIVQSVTRVMKEQFAKGMRKMMTEVGSQLEARIERKFPVEDSGMVDLERKTDSLFAQLEERIVALKHAQSSKPAKPRRLVNEPPILAEVRRLAAQEPMEAISAIAQWWKLNQPSEESDLLPIACTLISPDDARPLTDVSVGCFNLLVLTEWLRVNVGTAEKRIPILRAAKLVLSSLLLSDMTTLVGESRDLCSKSLSKAIRNSVSGTPDASLDVVGGIRELMLKFNAAASRASTPRSSITPMRTSASNVQGNSILQLLQSGSKR